MCARSRFLRLQAFTLSSKKEIMDFVRYKNLNGRSNVAAYRINYESIDVVFYGSTKKYRYSYKSAGKVNVNELIRRANQGYGLNSYINTNCKYLYE